MKFSGACVLSGSLRKKLFNVDTRKEHYLGGVFPVSRLIPVVSYYGMDIFLVRVNYYKHTNTVIHDELTTYTLYSDKRYLDITCFFSSTTYLITVKTV